MGSRRDRYENANIRGGLGVRKKLSEESFRPTYRLNGVQRGATIAECLDKYGRWEGGYRLGVLVRKTASWVYVKWDDEEEVAMVDHGDARYKVDRGKWRISNPRVGNPLNPQRGESTEALSKIADDPLLTGQSGNERIDHAADEGGSPQQTEEHQMSKEMSNAAAERAAAQKALKNGGFQERETYTAKQVAMRCGTDAKTMRKFFRSSASTVEPVGQGGRYDFDARDLPKIKQEFAAWSAKGKSKKVNIPTQKSSTKTGRPTPKQEMKLIVTATDDGEILDAKMSSEDMTLDELADAIEHAQEEDEEPTEEELEEIADLDLDLDDLDALED